jgi:tetratricopeptide (TPR) repeat protein
MVKRFFIGYLSLIISLSFLLFWSNNTAIAQEGIMSIQVTDESGKPLSNVEITVSDPARGSGFSLKTDDKGKAFKRGIPPSNYQISFVRKGYESQAFQFRLRAGVMERLNVKLKKSQPTIKGGEKFVIAAKLFNEGNYQEAIKYFKLVLEELPDYAEANYNLGLSYFKLDDIDNALDAFQKTIEFNPDLEAAYYALAECYFMKDRDDEAKAILARLIEKKSGDADTFYTVGLLYYKHERTDDAIELFNKARELNPNLASCHYNLGILYFKKGELDNSLEHFQKFLEIQPDAPEAPQVKEFIKEINKIKGEGNN